MLVSYFQFLLSNLVTIFRNWWLQHKDPSLKILLHSSLSFQLQKTNKIWPKPNWVVLPSSMLMTQWLLFDSSISCQPPNINKEVVSRMVKLLHLPFLEVRSIYRCHWNHCCCSNEFKHFLHKFIHDLNTKIVFPGLRKTSTGIFPRVLDSELPTVWLLSVRDTFARSKTIRLFR